MVYFSCAVSDCDELWVGAEMDSDRELKISVSNDNDDEIHVYLKPRQVEELANHLLKTIGQDNG